MKKKEIVIAFFLIAFGFIYNAVQKGQIRFFGDFSEYVNERRPVGEQFVEFPQKEMVFPAPEKASIVNAAGDINISPSADGQVHLLAFFKVYYQDKADVEQIGRQAKIRAGSENNELRISGDYALAFPYRRLRIRLELQVPGGVALAVHNHEGNIFIRHVGKDVFLRQENGNVLLEDVPSSVQLDIWHGDLDGKNIAGNVTIEANQSDIMLENAAALHVKGKHGNYSLKTIAGDAFIEHAFGEVVLDGARHAEVFGRHSRIAIRNIKNGVTLANAFEKTILENIAGEISLKGRSTKMEIRHVDTKGMVIENSFADIAIVDFTGESLNILLKNGDLDLQGKNIAERLNVESEQANINLDLGNLVDPAVSMKTVHGRIVNNAAIDLDMYQERDESFANRDGQKPDIIINNKYGDIHIK
jgi:DUF4097 and DUF4098 domain-containing protein YvlB